MAQPKFLTKEVFTRHPYLNRINWLRVKLGKKPLKQWKGGYHAINTYRIQLERLVLARSQ